MAELLPCPQKLPKMVTGQRARRVQGVTALLVRLRGGRMAAPTLPGVPLPQRSPPAVKTPMSPHFRAPAVAAPRLLVTDTRQPLRHRGARL